MFSIPLSIIAKSYSSSILTKVHLPAQAASYWVTVTDYSSPNVLVKAVILFLICLRQWVHPLPLRERHQQQS